MHIHLDSQIGTRMCAIVNPSESLSVDFSPFD